MYVDFCISCTIFATPVDFASARLDLDSLALLTFRHYIRSFADDRSDVSLT
jgi:hypothetical protein